MEIAGRTFLVSGGASGLGAATVRRLAELGAAVVIADLNAAEGERMAHHLGRHGIFVPTDVTNEAAVQAAVTAALEQFGGLHGAVSCAGIGVAEKVLSKRGVHALDSFRRVIDINLVGTFNVIRLAAAAMAQNEPAASGERGVIVNTASVAAFDGQVGQAAYAASKGAIVGMTLPIARDLGPLGIRVVTIAPGIFETPLMAGLPEAAQLSVLQQAVFPQRFGRPAEFAALVAHIVENPMLNGEVIRLDGAMRMGAK
jgi:NAD(P)-dependent dehydrogenase (short-subunit alcohol dehydrogenase family)